MKNLSLTFYLVAFVYVPLNLHLFLYPYPSPNLLSSSLKYDFAFEVSYGFRDSFWCLCVILTTPLSSPSHFLHISRSMKCWTFFSFWPAWNSKFSVRINVKTCLWTSSLDHRGIISPHTESFQNKQKPTEWNTGHGERKTTVWRTNNFQVIVFFLMCVCFKLCVRLWKGTFMLQKVA